MLNASNRQNRKTGDANVPGQPFALPVFPNSISSKPFGRFFEASGYSTAADESHGEDERDSFDLPGTPNVPNVPDSDLPESNANDDCARAQSYLSDYFDGELDTDTINLIETHLEGCPTCVAMADALIQIDEQLRREWQSDLPLPLSSLSPPLTSQERSAIDRIMSALPPEPAPMPDFAPHRIHARARWMRFSAGLAGLLALLGFCLHRS